MGRPGVPLPVASTKQENERLEQDFGHTLVSKRTENLVALREGREPVDIGDQGPTQP